MQTGKNQSMKNTIEIKNLKEIGGTTLILEKLIKGKKFYYS
jgi:hypothetical protein